MEHIILPPLPEYISECTMYGNFYIYYKRGDIKYGENSKFKGFIRIKAVSLDKDVTLINPHEPEFYKMFLIKKTVDKDLSTVFF
ncbi:hypothetical protein, partial [Bacillus pseudomycoides]|uniref:hypothetical protein n=1 Tax=Bacillus pseudomycoides TaxID=64104 RepID=UPI001C557748